jgi:hypothetical protein
MFENDKLLDLHDLQDWLRPIPIFMTRDDFHRGDRILRGEDRQAFLRQFMFDIRNGKHHILDAVAKEKTLVTALRSGLQGPELVGSIPRVWLRCSPCVTVTAQEGATGFALFHVRSHDR